VRSPARSRESSSASSSARSVSDVEIVGRLVEQQHVGTRDQRLGQMQPPALAAGQIANVLLLIAALKLKRPM
jgi:hypothetical protein